MLALGYYVKGSVRIAYALFMTLYTAMILAMSFMPERLLPPPPLPRTPVERPAVGTGANQDQVVQPGKEEAQKSESNPAPKRMTPPETSFMLRMMGTVIGSLTVLMFVMGAFTVYAGRCMAKRKNRRLIYVMASLNLIILPYGTLLGVCTLLILGSDGVKRAFGVIESK